MNILGRHVLMEMLKVFVITLTAMTSFMIVIGIVQQAIRESLTPDTILQLIPFVLPNALCFAIPGTILFSTCLIYGRMSAANEVIAVKSAGVSPFKLLLPAIVLAFSLSFLTVFLNDLAVSWGRHGVYKIVLHSVEKTIYSVLNSERKYAKGNLSISVADVQGDQLIQPIVEILEDGRAMRFEAEQARILVDPENEELVFEVQNAFGQDPNHSATISLDEGRIGIPLRNATKKNVETQSPSNMPLSSMSSATIQENKFFHNQQQLLAVRSAMGLASGDFYDLTSNRWKIDLKELKESRNRIYRLKTEPWRRWANGFSCLCFVLVGAPLAIHLRRSDFWTTFGVVFIPVLLAYYPLLMFGVTQSKSGRVPPPTVWIGNIVMILVGLWLVKRIVRN